MTEELKARFDSESFRENYFRYFGYGYYYSNDRLSLKRMRIA
ncbi:MAG: hypothetical protein R2764_00850 [Bacteroidales bacterium]